LRGAVPWLKLLRELFVDTERIIMRYVQVVKVHHLEPQAVRLVSLDAVGLRIPAHDTWRSDAEVPIVTGRCRSEVHNGRRLIRFALGLL